MSVPVRYSAASNFVAVDSGLSHTLTQEEQYHLQQQQQELFCPLYSNNNINCYNGNNSDCYELAEQQQLMQQRSSMSSSVTPQPEATIIHNRHSNSNSNSNCNSINANCGSSSSNNNIIINNNNSNININSNDNHNNFIMDHQDSSGVDAAVDELDMKPTTSAMALAMAAAAAAVAAAVVTDGECDNDNDNVEMTNAWMTASDEGRFGTPGAAGLEYQKYELEQQQQQQQQQESHTPAIDNNNDPHMEPSLMDNENVNDTNNKNIEEELNALSSDELYNTLKEYDALQDKYHTVLLLPKESRREVTAGGRDGSAYVLRCLKMWYELPSDVLFSAMSLVDRFLDRMAVKPKHMACMSVASFHLAIKQMGLKPIPADDLVTISQCGCTAGDLERMAGVIANKLGVQMGHVPITSVSYLRIYYALFRNLAKEIGGAFFDFYQQFIKLKELENRLEILLCDVKTTVITPSTLALVLICLHLDFHIKESYTKGSPELKHVFEYILFLQQYMRIPDRVFTCGFSIVSGILLHYNGQNKQPYKQRLVWKLSSRTLRVLRPTNRFSSDLPTIEEGISNALDDACRSRSESISSEEEEDWPTSPIIPIFEQC